MKRGLEVGASIPGVFIGNRQRAVALDLKELQRLAELAVALCLNQPGKHSPVLPDLTEVEVSLVSDRVIAQVHRRFMNIPGATDVITFPHGEIVVSATTAAREAKERGESVEWEVLRYVVHGMLHLNGHEDAVAEEAAAMWHAQETILKQIGTTVPRRP